MFAIISFTVGRPALAQDTTGTISGRIVDAQGLVLPGVTVTANGAQGSKTAVTDGEGRFAIAFLTPGSYSVHAELQGFTAVERSDVQVRLGQTLEIPLEMEVGGVEETIEVVRTTPAVDTNDTTVGASLDSATLSRL